VVATHWKVADESTAQLMVLFHGMLREGLSKDESLRRAMAETAAQPETRHPFFWAAFFLTGDADRPLQGPPRDRGVNIRKTPVSYSASKTGGDSVGPAPLPRCVPG
jgi:hypothetical protein